MGEDPLVQKLRESPGSDQREPRLLAKVHHLEMPSEVQDNCQVPCPRPEAEAHQTVRSKNSPSFLLMFLYLKSED
jgi:hypothetical protein